MNMFFQNIQVIFAVDPTMQGNDWTARISWYGCPNHDSTYKLALRLGKETNRTLLVCRLALVVPTSLQPLLNVDSGKKKFPHGGSSMMSVFIELAANSFGRNWTIQILIQLGSHFGGSSLMLSSHDAL